MKVQHSILYALGIFSLYGLLLFLVHLFVYDQQVPFTILLAVTGMFAFYFLTLRLGMLALLHPRIFIKVLGVLGLSLVVYTLYDLTYWFIYDLFPKWNIVLYNPRVVFSYPQFQANITGPFTTTALVSSISVIWTWFRRRIIRSRLTIQPRLIAYRQPDQIEPHMPSEEAVKETKVDQGTIFSVCSADKPGQQILLDSDNLIYAAIQDKTMAFYGKKKSWYGRISMNQLEEMLAEDHFIRIHRGLLINLKYLKNYGRGYARMHYRNHLMPVGGYYQKTLENAAQRFRVSRIKDPS